MARHSKQALESEKKKSHAKTVQTSEDNKFKSYELSSSKPKPKSHKGPIALGIILAIVVVMGVGHFFLDNFISGLGGGQQYTQLEEGSEVTVTIPDGATVQQMAETLGKSGIIKNDRDFTKRVKELGVESSLKPGKYRIVAGTDVDEIIAMLEAGPEAQGVTIPEGYTLAQIAQAVDDYTSGRISAEDFTEAATNADAFVEEFPFVKDAYEGSLEGFLFPKTYEVTDADTADTLIRKMLTQFQMETAGLDYTYPEKQGLSAYETLILASVIEKEATHENRTTVASVFYNRLNDDTMKLQSDATVAYVVGADPTPDDLKVDSPYNTYIVEGLPAGPICSPSLDSLKAACSPDETKYLYFYFTEDGEYTFSENYDDHQDAIADSN